MRVCVCVCVCDWVCVISSLKRQLHAEFLNGESFSVMTTKWHTHFSPTSFLISSTFLSLLLFFPASFVFSFISLSSVILCWSPQTYFNLSHFTMFLLSYFTPSLFPPYPLYFSHPFFIFLLLLPNHHNHQIKTACYCSLQNETHLSQLNLYKTLNKSRRKRGKKAGKGGDRKERIEESIKLLKGSEKGKKKRKKKMARRMKNY